MATEKQLEANRRNAQLSTGPKTQEGKDKVRRNALTHGLRAEAFDVLPNEDAGEFQERLDAWERGLSPTDQVEAQLVRHIAVVTWKKDRADRFENAVMSQMMLDAINACDCEDDDSQALIQAAAMTLFDPSNAGERLRRYQSALQRDFLKSLDTLTKLRAQEEKQKNAAIGANKAKSVAPIKANSEEDRQEGPTLKTEEAVESPIKANSEPIHANCLAPNKANLAPVAQVLTESVATAADSTSFGAWPIGVYSRALLDNGN